MTTATTTTALNHTTTAGFRLWVAEIIAQLIAVGLTQTADTGQINTATVNRPAVNTVAGYAVFRFNDTAQATSPLFIKFEFGTGTSANFSLMIVSIANGTNGAGTLTGLISDRVAITGDAAPGSAVTTWISRFCYVAAQGVLNFSWKQGSPGTAGVSMGGVLIFRSTDSAGAPTTDAVMLLSNSDNTAGNIGNSGAMQAISYLAGVAYNSGVAGWPNHFWMCVPFEITTTLFGGNEQVFPIFQYTPVIGISASCTMALNSEVGLGSTANMALIGATTHTFLNVGQCLANNSWSQFGFSASTYAMLMLWE